MSGRTKTFFGFLHHSMFHRFITSLFLVIGIFFFVLLSCPWTGLASAIFNPQPASSVPLNNVNSVNRLHDRHTLFHHSNSTSDPAHLPTAVNATLSSHQPYHLVASEALHSTTFSPGCGPTVREKNNASVDPGSCEVGPDGKYCGSLSLGVIKGEVFARPLESLFDFHMEGLNHNVTCRNETYIYNPATQHADVPGSRDPEDCLGELLLSANITLDVVYYPKKDEVKLDFGFSKIKCKKCE